MIASFGLPRVHLLQSTAIVFRIRFLATSRDTIDATIGGGCEDAFAFLFRTRRHSFVGKD